MENTPENFQNMILLVNIMKIKVLVAEALILREHEIREEGTDRRKRRGLHIHGFNTDIHGVNTDELNNRTLVPGERRSQHGAPGGYTDVHGANTVPTRTDSILGRPV